jgi:3-hydroxyisobutyrate dehydrogenase-like beta-hydroxyacid dehydrogenase
MRIGFIGLGIMGAPMARNLLRAGHALTVHNRTRARAEPLVAAGATAADSPAAVAGAVEAVITMLPDTPDVEAVLAGPGGVLAGARPGLLAIDMSTSRPTSRAGSEQRCGGRRLLDAPASGGDRRSRHALIAVGARRRIERAALISRRSAGTCAWRPARAR